MENWNPSQMTPFDCRIANQNLELTKLLIPYLPPESQRVLAVYVKFAEFQNTFSSFRTFRRKNYSTMDIFEELKPYMPPSAWESIDNFMSMMSMMDMFQSMQDDFDPMSMMQNMFTNEGGEENARMDE